MESTLFTPSQLLGLLPEIVLVFTSLAVLAVDLASGRAVNRRTLAWLTAAGMALSLLASVIFPPTGDMLLGGLLRSDTFGWTFRAIFLIGAALSALVASEFKHFPVRSFGKLRTGSEGLEGRTSDCDTVSRARG